MRKALLAGAAFMVAAAVSIAYAQAPQGETPPAAGAGTPAEKQPAPKSQAEAQAFQAIFTAPDPDTRIKNVDEFVTKYPDSDFKAYALAAAAEGWREKNDADKAIIYSERTLEANPSTWIKLNAMAMIAATLAPRTREFDLDKEEKLGRIEKYSKEVLDQAPNAPKPRPDLPEDQWTAAKNSLMAQAHESLGQVAMLRKKYDNAISEFQIAAKDPNAQTAQIRLGEAYSAAGKLDEAIAEFDKVIADPQTPPAFKNYAQQAKNKAVQKKSGGAAAPAPGAAASPAPGGDTPAPTPSPAPAPPKP